MHKQTISYKKYLKDLKTAEDAQDKFFKSGQEVGYKQGKCDGYAEGRKSAIDAKVKASIDLINAAGQAMNAIAHTLDNAHVI